MRSTFYRVSRLVVLPDYQGIGIGKKLLNFMAKYYTERTNVSFHIITSNPQLIRANLGAGWHIAHAGHQKTQRITTKFAAKRGGDISRLMDATSRDRLTVSLSYDPKPRREGHG